MKSPMSVSKDRKRAIVIGVGVRAVIFGLFCIFMPPHKGGTTEPIKENCYLFGELKSRTQIKNGAPHGLSEGWYTNGVADGQRTKWFVTGEKKSEVDIVSGMIHGRFKKGYKNG